MTDSQITAMYDKAAALRGMIINRTVYIERSIDQFIASHFCEDQKKKDELLVLIICERLVFDAKKQIFETILKNTLPEFYAKNKADIGHLTTIMEERNILAHYLLNTTEDGIKQFIDQGELTFVKFKNEVKITVFDKQRIADLIARIGKIDSLFKNGIQNY